MTRLRMKQEVQKNYSTDEIENMPTGPEMDELIGKGLGLDVLGITLCSPRPEGTGYYVPYWRAGSVLRPVYLGTCYCEFQRPINILHFGHIACCLGVVENYSSQIVAAWEVVKAFRMGWDHHAAACIKIVILDDAIREDTKVVIYSPDIKIVSAIGPTTPLAICRAAGIVFAQSHSK